MKAILPVLGVLSSFQLGLVVYKVLISPSSKKGVKIDVDTSQAPDLANFAAKVKATLEEWYTPIKTILHSSEFKEIDRIQLYFDPNYHGAAYAVWEQNLIVGSVKFYRENPHDVGSMIHELVHIIQQYPWRSPGACPGWLTEGIADWIRYFRYEPNNKPLKPWSYQNYTEGYKPAAYFLDFLNSKWSNVVTLLNMNCRAGRYNDTVFKNKWGKNKNEFWEEMIAEKGQFTVVLDTSQAPEMEEFSKKVKLTLEKWYPYFAEKLWSPSFEPVDGIKVSFVKEMNGAMGYHSLEDKSIVGAAGYFGKNEDLGFWVKNMVHIIQQYKGKKCPDWVKSGIVDWAWYFHVERMNMMKPRDGLGYKDGWWISGYFMNWLDEKYAKMFKPSTLTSYLNWECREDTFDEEVLFKRLTGKMANELWNEMMRN